MPKADIKLPDYMKVGESFTVPIGGTDLLARALRVVRDNCSLAYGKLVALDWQATNMTPYGATDGVRLLLNPSGLVKLSKTSNPVGYTAFLLLHEAYHALLGHGHRLKDLDPKLRNIAADYAINWLIDRENQDAGKNLFPIIEGALLEERFGNMSAIEIYKQLLSENPPTGGDKPDGPTGPTGQPSDEEGEDGDGPLTEDTDEEGEDGGSTTTQQPVEESDEDSDDEGSGADGTDGDEDGDGKGQTDSDILGDDFAGKGGEDSLKPEVDPDSNETEEELEKRIEEENEKVILIEEMAEATGTGGSASTREVADQNRKATEDQDWVRQLKDWMTSRVDEGWNKLFNTQMYSSTGMVCAGRESKAAGELVVVIDTSGSIYDDLLTMFLDTVEEFLNEVKPRVLHLVSADYRVRETYELREGDIIPRKLKGGGGTAFVPSFEWAEENVPHCDGLVYITDGATYDLQDIHEPDFPVFWVSWWRQAEDYPFGEAVRINPHKLFGTSYQHTW